MQTFNVLHPLCAHEPCPAYLGNLLAASAIHLVTETFSSRNLALFHYLLQAIAATSPPAGPL